MGVPDIIAGPAKILGVLTGAAAEHLQRIGNILVVFSQMRMHHHAFVARQNRRIAHERATDRERAAGCYANPDHRAGVRVMEGIDYADAVLQDRRFAFDQRIRRQAAIAFTNAHRTAGGVKTQADVLSGSNCIVQPRTIGVKIQVVGRQRAA